MPCKNSSKYQGFKNCCNTHVKLMYLIIISISYNPYALIICAILSVLEKQMEYLLIQLLAVVFGHCVISRLVYHMSAARVSYRPRKFGPSTTQFKSTWWPIVHIKERDIFIASICSFNVKSNSDALYVQVTLCDLIVQIRYRTHLSNEVSSWHHNIIDLYEAVELIILDVLCDTLFQSCDIQDSTIAIRL